MAYANSHEPGKPMDSAYDDATDALLRRERLRHEAAATPREGFDGDFLFGKRRTTPYLTPQERQRREADERGARKDVTE